MVVATRAAESASLARPMGLKRVDLTCLRLKVQHLGPQEASVCCRVRTSDLLLLCGVVLLRATWVVPVVTCGALLLASAYLGLV